MKDEEDLRWWVRLVKNAWMAVVAAKYPLERRSHWATQRGLGLHLLLPWEWQKSLLAIAREKMRGVHDSGV
jgi:hypothetical protein